MRLRINLLSLFIAHVLLTAAQKQSNTWYFGNQAGLDFNTTPPTALLDGQTYFPLPNQWNEGTSSICDSTGALLFYSNGEVIWNRDHQVMPNGGDLLGHASSTQASLIVPRPLSDRYFYVFTTDASENGFENGFRYSVVDICLDGEKGDVMAGHKNVLLRGAMSEKIAVVSHANGADYWVVGHEFNTDVFHVYLLTASGIIDSLQMAVGPVDAVGWGAQIVFSPDGTHLAYGVPAVSGYMALFDFDASNGMITNARIRPPDFFQGNVLQSVWGIAFSADGSKLYLSTMNYGTLRQLDLNAGSWPAVLASAVVLGTIVPGAWGSLCLGPDDMIYMAKTGYPYLARIGSPNVGGLGCSFSDDAVELAANSSFGLPSVVAGYQYRNAVISATDCAQHPIAVPEEDACVPGSLVIARDGYCAMTLCRAISNGRLELYATEGSRVKEIPLRDGRSIAVDLGGLPVGLYVYRIMDSSGFMIRGCLIVQ